MTNIKDYLINNKFIFETENCLVFLKGEPDKFIELSKPASRLLSEIIILNQQAKIATRDELLTNVWEKYGLVGSNNNLNTYISEIRKKIEIIGIDPKSIVTVPKRGFRFDCETLEIITQENNTSILQEKEFIHYDDKSELIKNEYQNINDDDLNETHDNQRIINNNSEIEKHLATEQENSNSNEMVQFQAVKKPENISNNYILFILITIVTISLTLTFHFIKDSDASMQINGYVTVSQRDKCIIQTPIHLAENSSKDHIDFINKKLDKYNVDCNEPKRIILLSEPNNTQLVDKNFSISICKEKNTKYDCVSINDQRI